MGGRRPQVLEEAAADSGLELVPDPGGAAFYGPKISVQARDAIGRTWQMSTIQYDFNQPERFGLEYQAADGSRQQPVMIHSAKFGSIERFLGVLVEHYAGAFPAWLAPVQVLGIPVAEELRRLPPGRAGPAAAARESASSSTRRTTGSRRRSATRASPKVPFVLIAGEDDRAAGAVSFRYRDGSQRERRAGRRRHPGGRAQVDPARSSRSAEPEHATEPCRGRAPPASGSDAWHAFERLWTPHRMVYIDGDKPDRRGRRRLPVLRGPDARTTPRASSCTAASTATS